LNPKAPVKQTPETVHRGRGVLGCADIASPVVQCTMVLSYLTGLRQGDVLGLTRRNVADEGLVVRHRQHRPADALRVGAGAPHRCRASQGATRGDARDASALRQRRASTHPRRPQGDVTAGRGGGPGRRTLHFPRHPRQGGESSCNPAAARGGVCQKRTITRRSWRPCSIRSRRYCPYRNHHSV
jgi:hypothetical protein